MQVNQELLDRCKKNDARAQRVLYDNFKSIAMGTCRRYCKNKEEAEDVFQESFIRIFKNIDQLNGIDHLEPWIKRICVNTSINYYHKQKRHYYHVDYLDHDSENEAYEMIMSNFSDEKLIELINSLPDGYRMVFNLYVVEGYSHAEIATLLHISEVTSRSQLNRARQVLKEQLMTLGISKYERYA